VAYATAIVIIREPAPEREPALFVYAFIVVLHVRRRATRWGPSREHLVSRPVASIRDARSRKASTEWQGAKTRKKNLLNGSVSTTGICTVTIYRWTKAETVNEKSPGGTFPCLPGVLI